MNFLGRRRMATHHVEMTFDRTQKVKNIFALGKTLLKEEALWLFYLFSTCYGAMKGERLKRQSKENIMKLRNMRPWGLGVFFAALFTASFLCIPSISRAFDISIQVSPSTLNLQSFGEVVTVHTNIAFSSVVGGTVSLNGIPISWWKADNQGNFVAKFEMTEVKALADSGSLSVPGENTLTLNGTTTDGATFTGSTSITVINVQPAGSSKK